MTEKEKCEMPKKGFFNGTSQDRLPKKKLHSHKTVLWPMFNSTLCSSVKVNFHSNRALLPL
uniref:Uncharacterized protein n=1 Tax=Anguilla anguilla TaxID=7936 RepID=A0A0E9WAE6_ANGAN